MVRYVGLDVHKVWTEVARHLLVLGGVAAAQRPGVGLGLDAVCRDAGHVGSG